MHPVREDWGDQGHGTDPVDWLGAIDPGYWPKCYVSFYN